MAYSYVAFTGDGVLTQFPITFPYIAAEDISVTVDGVVTAHTLISPTVVELASAPANGITVVVRRNTEVAAPLVDFANGAMLTEDHLDLNTQQMLYAVQEARDASASEVFNEAQLADAAAGVNSFRRTYLGARATAPTTDLLGDPLAAGAQYFNTVSGRLLHYTGSAWVEIAPAYIINVMTKHGARGDLSDDTDELNAAIADFNANGGILFFPNAEYNIGAPLNQITFHGGRVVGAGMDTRLWANFSSGFILDIRGQFTSVEFLSFQSLIWAPDVRGLNVQGGFRNFITNCFFTWIGGAITINGSGTVVLHKLDLRYMQGSTGINITGTAVAGTFGIQIAHTIADNPAPLGYGAVRTYADAAAFRDTDVALGDMFRLFGYIWQCTQAGHTATTGDLNVLTTSYYDWALTDVTHGTAKFRMVCNEGLVWCRFGSYANSLTTICCGFINGAYGFLQTDEAAVPGSHPNWSLHYDMETDHCFRGGVIVNGGLGFWMTISWIGSSLEGHGIDFGAGFMGEATVTATRIMGNALHGINVSAGTDLDFNHNVISANSAASPGTYSAIHVGNSVSGWSACHNRGGTIIGVGAGWQKHVVDIDVGTSDSYIAVYNIGRGNAGATINDGGSGSNKIIAPNL